MAGRFCWLVLLLTAALAGCDDDELTRIDFGPTGQPRVAFADPASPSGEPVCVEVGDGVDFRLPILVKTEELILRPPGTCGIYGQCGHLQLFANDVPNNEAAVRSIDLLMRKIPDRYHDGSPHAVTGEPDVLRLRIQVVNVNEEPLVDRDGVPLEDELPLLTVRSCDELP